NRNGTTNIPALLDQFPVGNQTGIGQGQASPGHRETAHKPHLETRFLNQPGRHGVVAPRHDTNAGCRKELFQPSGYRGHVLFSSQSVGEWKTERSGNGSYEDTFSVTRSSCVASFGLGKSTPRLITKLEASSML